MIAIKNSQYITPQEYLEWEEKQPIKYEYIDGKVIAMTGGTIPHSEIVANKFFQGTILNHNFFSSYRGSD